MHTYEAHNYALGRQVQSIRFEAYGDDEALRVAEAKLTGRHASGPRGKVRVLGLKKVKA